MAGICGCDRAMELAVILLFSDKKRAKTAGSCIEIQESY